MISLYQLSYSQEIPKNWLKSPFFSHFRLKIGLSPPPPPPPQSLLPCPVVHFEWTIEVLVGFHLIEPFLGLMLDLQPRPTHVKLRTVFQNLHKHMTELIPGQFCRATCSPCTYRWLHQRVQKGVDGFIQKTLGNL